MEKFGVILAYLVVILIILAGPILVIWALNQLFALGIAYSFLNWLAVVVLSAAVKTKVEYSR